MMMTMMIMMVLEAQAKGEESRRECCRMTWHQSQ